MNFLCFFFHTYYLSRIITLKLHLITMKKIVLLLAFCLSIGNLFAQDADANKICSEGDAAMKAKDYATAVTKYSEYLKLTNYEDADRVFNCGYAAFNAKKYDDAIKFYDMAIEKGKNVDNAYVGKAMSLREQDKAAEFTSAVEAGLKVNPANANLEKLLYVYCIKEGQEAQKAGQIEKAEEMFKDVLVVNNKTFKGNALYSLGAMFYNQGANILKAATPIATTDADKYKAEKEKADAQMLKAKGYLEQAIALNPADANSKKILDAINATVK